MLLPAPMFSPFTLCSVKVYKVSAPQHTITARTIHRQGMFASSYSPFLLKLNGKERKSTLEEWVEIDIKVQYCQDTEGSTLLWPLYFYTFTSVLHSRVGKHPDRSATTHWCYTHVAEWTGSWCGSIGPVAFHWFDIILWWNTRTTSGSRKVPRRSSIKQQSGRSPWKIYAM